MSELVSEAWQAGIDAVVADNTLNRSGFVDAMQTVITAGLSNSEGNDYVDAVAGVYEQSNIINNATYNNLRGHIIDDPVKHRTSYDNLSNVLNQLPEFEPVRQAAVLMDLREDRDQVNAAITRCDDLIAAEPAGTVGRLVKDVLRQGKRSLREYKEQLRDQIRNETGDPDS